MRNLLIVAASAVGLSACSSEPPVQHLKAGLWTATGTDGMLTMNKPNSVCLSETAASQNLIEADWFTGLRDECTRDKLTMADGKISGRMSCGLQIGGREIYYEVEGEFGADYYSVRSTEHSGFDPNSEIGKLAPAVWKIEGKRTGDCQN